jgi:hypothetical protein
VAQVSNLDRSVFTGKLAHEQEREEMSWNAPKNWDEAVFSVSRGFRFYWDKEGISSGTVAVCGDPRRELLGHLDEFAHEIIASYDRLHAAYMSEGRPGCLLAEDIVYFVMVNRNPIAYVTRGGEVKTNPKTRQADSKTKKALKRLFPALEEYGRSLASADPSNWL